MTKSELRVRASSSITRLRHLLQISLKSGDAPKIKIIRNMGGFLLAHIGKLEIYLLFLKKILNSYEINSHLTDNGTLRISDRNNLLSSWWEKNYFSSNVFLIWKFGIDVSLSIILNFLWGQGWYFVYFNLTVCTHNYIYIAQTNSGLLDADFDLIFTCEWTILHDEKFPPLSVYSWIDEREMFAW